MSGQIEQYLEQEISELKAQIASMTKDMDSLEKQLEMADAAIERWKAENEELRQQLAEAKKDAERWNFFIEVLQKDTGESIAKFLPEEPMENFTKETIDDAIDQAMREGE